MKILVAVDGSAYTKRMLAYLAANNELLGPDHDYTVFTAVSSIPAYATRFAGAQATTEHYEEQAQQVLAPIKAFVDQQGWKAQMRHAAGYAPDAIAAFANEHKPDLLVMGTHGETALSNLVLGSVVTGVLARCKVPVLLIR